MSIEYRSFCFQEYLSKQQSRNVPGSALYFFALSEIREVLTRTGRSWQPILNKSIPNTADYRRWENLVSGSAARGAVGYIMMPITVVKVRYEVILTVR